jgi:hypothetical protein
MENSIKLKSKNIINYHVASDIGSFVAKNLNYEGMSSLQDKYFAILTEYQSNPVLNILSTIKMDKLEAFNQWIPEAYNDSKTVIPFLVANMFRGDIYSLNMYDNICRYGRQEELIISYDKIHNDPELKEIFMQYGGAEDARAIMAAEHWLESLVAAQIFESSDDIEILCAVNSMLHIHNSYVDC